METTCDLASKKYDNINNIEKAYEEIIDRAITDEERDRLHRVKDALKIGSTDTLWLLLLQLERYQSLYDAVPEKISSVVDECITQIKEATQDEIRRVEIDIERKAFKTAQDFTTMEYALLHQINESTERILLVQQKALIEASTNAKKIKIWSTVGIVALIQMLIIILTNSVTAIIATGNSTLPWISMGEGNTKSTYIYQLIWNFPSGWVMSFMMVFGIAFIIYDKFINKKKVDS
ncbi:hypothetical protein [Methylobacter svalbardensis]|uniref:hypothetical protein n=1 Tax=Methylobacter svalbardensis TaxID=3080016 RepID=UPI0030EEF4F7